MDCYDFIQHLQNIIDKSTAAQTFSVDNLSYLELQKFIREYLSTWKANEIGQSFLGRKIYSFSLGNPQGKTVLIWSQMHGNEPASTIALLMLMEYLNNQNNPWVKEILAYFYFSLIPMLNPDGSELFIRRNAQWIDINRDARRLSSPEASVLREQFDKLKAKYCFNLHDQEIYYAPSGANKPTAMAFLVPAGDEKKSITPARKQGMDILGYIIKCLDNYTLAKYKDDFMPNAFGDYFSMKGAVTMLFETGYIIGDDLRKKTSKLHALALILALIRIMKSKQPDDFSEFYLNLPFNTKHAFFDFIMRNVVLQSSQREFIVDIALSRKRLDPDTSVSPQGDYFIYDIGDLQDKKAFVEKDFHGDLRLPTEKIFMYAPANWLINYF